MKTYAVEFTARLIVEIDATGPGAAQDAIAQAFADWQGVDPLAEKKLLLTDPGPLADRFATVKTCTIVDSDDSSVKEA